MKHIHDKWEGILMAEDFVTKTSDGAVRKLKLVLIYVLFIFINISANRFVKYLGLPLYIDNIGTLLGAVLGGYLPGIFVGYLTNIINSTADITNMYYAGVSVLIAFTATFLAKRGFYDTWWKALLTIPFLAFFGGGVGSVLTWFIYGSDLTFAAQLWSDLKLDLLDKAITVVISFVLIKILPKTSSSLLALTDWRQKAMTRSEIREARNHGDRYFCHDRHQFFPLSQFCAGAVYHHRQKCGYHDRPDHRRGPDQRLPDRGRLRTGLCGYAAETLQTA